MQVDRTIVEALEPVADTEPNHRYPLGSIRVRNLDGTLQATATDGRVVLDVHYPSDRDEDGEVLEALLPAAAAAQLARKAKPTKRMRSKKPESGSIHFRVNEDDTIHATVSDGNGSAAEATWQKPGLTYPMVEQSIPSVRRRIHWSYRSPQVDGEPAAISKDDAVHVRLNARMFGELLLSIAKILESEERDPWVTVEVPLGVNIPVTAREYPRNDGRVSITGAIMPMREED